MAYETFLSDLEQIVAGNNLPERAVRISVKRSWFGESRPERVTGALEGSTLDIAVFDRSAVAGHRALLVVALNPLTEIDHLPHGSNAVAVGVLEVGRAIALRINDELHLPSAPASRPVFRIPKL